MSEETIRCPKCGTENSTDDKFCQECGKNLSKYIYNKNEKLTKALMFPFLVEIVGFLIIAIVIAIALGLFLFLFPNNFTITSGQNTTILDQIYNNVTNYGSTVCLFLGGLIGAMFVFCIWSVFKFNRLERRIIETQEMIISKKE